MIYPGEVPEWALKALKDGLNQLRDNLPKYQRRRAYYEGAHPAIWATEQLRELFERMSDEIGIENWCELAINTPLKRLSVEAFEGDTAEPALAAWDELGLDRTQYDLYLDVLTCGVGYVSLWKGADGVLEADINRPEDIAWGPQRRPGSPPAWVAKFWVDEVANQWRATVWDSTEAIRFVGPKISEFGGVVLPQGPQGFELDTEEPGGAHGFSAPPVVKFDQGRGRKPIIDTIRRPQDRLNKLQTNRMVAAEHGAWPMRWALTTQRISNGDAVAKPDRMMVLDPGERDAPTSLGQFAATDLKNYDDAIDRERDTIFTMATLPRHLNVAHGGSPASGAAVQADEGPFIESLRDIQRALGAAWADFYELLGLDIEPRWSPAETKDLAAEALAVKTLTDAGMPLRLALRSVSGWTDEQLDELEALKDEADAKAVELFQQQQPDPNAADEDAQVAAQPADE